MTVRPCFHVLRGGHNPEVFSPIVQRVAIDVIDLHVVWRAKEKSMELNVLTRPWHGPSCIERIGGSRRAPEVAGDKGDVCPINDGCHAFGERECGCAVAIVDRQPMYGHPMLIPRDRAGLTLGRPVLEGDDFQVRTPVIESIPVSMGDPCPVGDIAHQESMEVHRMGTPILTEAPAYSPRCSVPMARPSELTNQLLVGLINQRKLAVGKGKAYSTHIGQLLTVVRSRLGLSQAAPGLSCASILPQIPVISGFLASWR